MIVYGQYNHDRGEWAVNTYHDDTEARGSQLTPDFARNLILHGEIISGDKNRGGKSINQIVEVKNGIAYSALDKPDFNRIASRRQIFVFQDATYRLMSEHTIDRIINFPDFEKGEPDYLKLKEIQRKETGGNWDIFIDKNVLKQILYYIVSQSNVTNAKGFLIIKVPSYGIDNQGQYHTVDYTAYCRAIIGKILHSLPIELRNNISFATCPNEEGLKEVGIAFEPMDFPIPTNNRSYCSNQPVSVNLHDKSCLQDPRISEGIFLDDTYKKIISACVDYPSLPEKFYTYCVKTNKIDYAGSISQLGYEDFKNTFNEFLMELSRDSGINARNT